MKDTGEIMEHILNIFVNENVVIFLAGNFNIYMHYENNDRCKLFTLLGSYNLRATLDGHNECF